MVNAMKNVKSLLVIWQNKETSLYYHIGTLTFDGITYFFTYTHHNDSPRTVMEAIRNGYFLHPSFPVIDKTYKSENLFPAFDRRIPSAEREDYNLILNDLGLDLNSDRMDILRVTRGMLSGDTYSFEQPLRLKNNKLQTDFYINGMRYQNLPENWNMNIHKDDCLQLIPEPSNPYDKRAVRIETLSGIHLGYVPGFYAEAIKSLIEYNTRPILTIKEIRPKSSPQWWVHTEFSCDIKNPGSFFHEVSLSGVIEAA
jgi:hypothetical protein